MILGGLWHGAAYQFLIWGTLHGVALVVHREWSRSRAPSDRTAVRWVSRLATFWFVCLCWIFFRTEGLGDALVTLESFVLLRSPGETGLDPAWWLFLALLGPLHFVGRRLAAPSARLPGWGFGAAYGVAIAVVLLFVRFAAQPFIYFQF